MQIWPFCKRKCFKCLKYVKQYCLILESLKLLRSWTQHWLLHLWNFVFNQNWIDLTAADSHGLLFKNIFSRENFFAYVQCPDLCTCLIISLLADLKRSSPFFCILVKYRLQTLRNHMRRKVCSFLMVLLKEDFFKKWRLFLLTFCKCIRKSANKLGLYQECHLVSALQPNVKVILVAS